MTKIPNWPKTLHRNVSDVLGMAGTVREWENEETGDTISVVHMKAENSGHRDGPWYNIEHNGEAVSAEGTLGNAENNAIQTMRNNEEGL